jgi:putative peptidoglycan lipid II flippase
VPAIAIAAPMLTRWMGRGLDPVHQAEAARMLRLLSLLLIPSGVAGALAGILHARRRFLPFAVGRVMSLFAQMVFLYVLVVYAALRLDALAWATLAGALVLLLCCVPGFLRTGFRYYPVLRWRGDQERAIFTVALVMVAFSMIDRLNQVVNRFAASFLDAGSISALEFGWRFEIPIVHVLSMSVALPTLAIMAGQAGEKQWTELRATAAESMRLMMLLVIPFIGFIVVMREPLTSVWFERGAFSSGSARVVSSLLPFMGVMFLMRAFGTITVYGLLSLRKLRVLLAVLSVEAMVNIALNLLFFRRLGLQGVVLATALAMTFGNIWLGRILLKSLHDWSARELASELRKPVIASVSSVVALAAFFRTFGVGWVGDTHLAKAIELGLIGFAFFAGHLALASRLRLVEIPVPSVFRRVPRDRPQATAFR